MATFAQVPQTNRNVYGIAVKNTINAVITQSNSNKTAVDSVRAGTLGSIPGLTATADELNILDGATLETAELNYVDGVTSAIQTQMDAKLNTADTTDLSSVVRILTDTMLVFNANYGVGNVGDTVGFQLDSIIWEVEWEGSQTLVMTKISAKVRGTSPDVDLAFLSNTTPVAAGATAVLSSDMTVTSTTTWTDATTFNDAQLAPGETLMLRLDQLTAKPRRLVFNIFGYLTE